VEPEPLVCLSEPPGPEVCLDVIEPPVPPEVGEQLPKTLPKEALPEICLSVAPVKEPPVLPQPCLSIREP
jgi:hypothetical protein